jgi:hypothetical protein
VTTVSTSPDAARPARSSRDSIPLAPSPIRARYRSVLGGVPGRLA